MWAITQQINDIRENPLVVPVMILTVLLIVHQVLQFVYSLYYRI